MRVLRPQTDAVPPLLPKLGLRSVVISSISAPGTFTLGDDSAVAATCLRCPSHPCTTFLDEELPHDGMGIRRAVCPADAITIEAGMGAVITDACFGCGLCVIRCPYGSLYIGEATAEVGPVETSYEDVSGEQFIREVAGVAIARDLNREDAADLVGHLGERDQTHFYPFVAAGFTALGLPTRTGNHGDTSSRFDALMLAETLAAPIEMKSPLEVRQINVKSVQQALENKIVFDTRFEHIDGDFPSLVVGYLPPGGSSDVVELVNDIAIRYGIRIRLISLEHLFRWLLDHASGQHLDLAEIRDSYGLV